MRGIKFPGGTCAMLPENFIRFIDFRESGAPPTYTEFCKPTG
jgi:hypothetical protein